MPMGVYPRRYIPAADRFWPKVQKTEGCWLWTGGRNSNGYGTFGLNGTKSTAAHRFSWELVNGSIPHGMWVLHRCDVRHCVRPSHLFLGTRQDNTDDMLGKGRQTRGVDKALAKLTDEIVRTVRSRHAAGGVTLTALAAEYGVSLQVMWMAVTRRTWRHVA
jgi:hypothetical protein